MKWFKTLAGFLTTVNVFYSMLAQGMAWEAWTIVNNKPGDTLSATIRAMGESQPAIPFAMAATCGHLWRGASLRFKLAMIFGFIMGVLFWPLIDKARATDET